MQGTRFLRLKKNTATEALVGTFAVVLGAAVVTALYFGRGVLVPLAVAALLTFTLSPLVACLERFIGRAVSVALVSVLVFTILGGIAWTLARQTLDLAKRLPSYRANIVEKIHSLELSREGPIKRFYRLVAEIESEIPGLTPVPPKTAVPVVAVAAQPDHPPVAVSPAAWIVPFAELLGQCGIVVLLVIFMLLKREDLRGRLIKIVGQGRISTTSRAMEDAGTRIARYLSTQLIVNVLFGSAFAAGLWLIGIPNALLWGMLAAALRFIPYIGAWMAGVCPILLSFAVSPGWGMLVWTLGLFIFLEIVTGNFVEPLLYRSSTGVSSIALIVAAIFWTWIWGPVGLLLATPLTVCLGVIGRHVPRLAFFSILLGNEEALTPAEECYHRLLVGGLADAGRVVDEHLQKTSLASVYDAVLVPAVTLAEMDFEREDLDEAQRRRVLQGLRDMIDDLGSRAVPASSLEADKLIAASEAVRPTVSDCRVVCTSTRGERDELAAAMLAHLLQQQGAMTTSTPAGSIEPLARQISEFNADAVCVSVIPPTTVIHARYLCSRLRSRFPDLKIIVGLWGATEAMDGAVKALQSSGANEVVVSMAEAVVQVARLSTELEDRPVAARQPENEEARLQAVQAFEAVSAGRKSDFDDVTQRLTRTFDVSFALLTLVGRDQQVIKSHHGLGDGAAALCEIPRHESVCNHVVGENAVLMVEDLWKDRRFSKNPLVRKFGLRFYAGAPVRGADGHPVGALCVIDTKARRFTESEMRLLKIFAQEISDKLVTHPSPLSIAA